MGRTPTAPGNHLQPSKIGKIKISKCQFFRQHLHYLRYFILKQSIQPPQEKLTVILNLKEPNNVNEFHHFLGLTGYYRKFVTFTCQYNKTLIYVSYKR